ncbi:Aste57867_17645 [Aphanomyces stellatus]|uniref:Glutathione peroxidase n=1 Tax=Aphanomyces stellatus TaxID=120398 RepID=A0A485LBU7_9STRA|nr:hypothetical protein As57867_017585 [Aphanomyces stellatus]VFT94396.1 Aste57867_17645 [Aphanomyces stellatus]
MSRLSEYRAQGLEILAFPSNQFGHQEPGTDEEIKAFVQKFGVKFPLFHKDDVKGPTAQLVFQYLNAKLDPPDWNFTKFLINRQGQPVKRYAPGVPPKDIASDIEELL